MILCFFKMFFTVTSLSSPVSNVQFWTLMRFSCLTAYIWRLAPKKQELCFRSWSKAGSDQKCLGRTEVGFLLTWFYCTNTLFDETMHLGLDNSLRNHEKLEDYFQPFPRLLQTCHFCNQNHMNMIKVKQ